MLDPLALAVYCYLIFLFSFCLWHRDMKMHLIIVFFLFFSLLPTYFCSFFFSFHLNEIVGHAKDWPSTRSSSEEKKKRKKKTQMFWRSYPLLLFALSVSCLEWCVFFLLCISRLIPARWRLCSQPHGQTIQIKKEQIHFYTWQELCISDVILCIVRRLSWRREMWIWAQHLDIFNIFWNENQRWRWRIISQIENCQIKICFMMSSA